MLVIRYGFIYIALKKQQQQQTNWRWPLMHGQVWHSLRIGSLDPRLSRQNGPSDGAYRLWIPWKNLRSPGMCYIPLYDFKEFSGFKLDVCVLSLFKCQVFILIDFFQGPSRPVYVFKCALGSRWLYRHCCLHSECLHCQVHCVCRFSLFLGKGWRRSIVKTFLFDFFAV